MKLDSIITTEGMAAIPDPLQKELGIGAGSVISWQAQGGKLVGVKKADTENAMLGHIRKYSGSWKGVAKVLEKTR